MAITEIQHTSDHGGPDTKPHQTWATIPTQLNLLVAVVSWEIAAGQANLTMPAGWHLACDIYLTGKARQAIYYKVATAAEQQKVQGTLTASRRWAIELVEANSTLPSGWVLDRTATKTGSGTTPTTGTTLVTTTAEEYWVGAQSSSNNVTLSAPLNSFAILEQQTSSPLSLVMLTKVVAVAAAASSGGTYSSSVQWVGGIATFMAQPKTVVAAGATLAGRGLLTARGYYSTPTLVVQAAFGYGASDPDPAWTDISAYARSCNWARGRQNELNQMEAGTAHVVLNDEDSHFDANNPDSPFYPNVKPGLPVRATLFVGSAMYPLFYGFAERLPRTVRVTDVYTQRQIDLTDGFALLAAAGLGGQTYGEESSDERVNAVANDVSWPESDRAIGVGASTLQEKEFPDDDDTRAQTHLQQVADSENGLLFVDGAKVLRFVGRHELLSDDRYTAPRATFGDV